VPVAFGDAVRYASGPLRGSALETRSGIRPKGSNPLGGTSPAIRGPAMRAIRRSASRHDPEETRRRAVMHVDSTRTLLLNQGYEPIKIVSWQRAMTLITLDKVDVVEEYDAQIRAASLVIQIPSIVRLRKAYRRHAKPVKFSRVNIYARDDYRCQYCGARCAIDQLTYDHVIPRSRGGRTVWDNIVSCCYACNAKKANRTPAEARMTLRSVPDRPTWMPAVQIRVSAKSIPDAWRDYVYWTGELEREDQSV
jgi:5-methylcytosine-specific restriction endonuclease McrA